MDQSISIAEPRAIIAGDRSVVENISGDKSVGSDENWFSDAVLRLLGTDKPGTALDCITELRFGDRNCQRYAAGDVKPPAYFLRAILRGKHGEPFLHALMDGCESEWWLDHQRRLTNGAKVDQARFE